MRNKGRAKIYYQEALCKKDGSQRFERTRIIYPNGLAEYELAFIANIYILWGIYHVGLKCIQMLRKNNL